MPSEVKIRPAPAEELIDLRWKLLRAGLARETAKFEGDDEAESRHIAAEYQGIIVGCATFMRRPLEGKPAWQLRGMAVQADLQKSGIGRAMLAFAEDMLRSEKYSDLLWCHGRIGAKAFYERLGWKTISDVYQVPPAPDLHVKMSKRLEPQLNTNHHR
jgi:predicted N-acetyltransferase YhbS